MSEMGDMRSKEEMRKEDDDTPKEDEDTPKEDEDTPKEDDTGNEAQVRQMARAEPIRDRPIAEAAEAPPGRTEEPVEHQPMGPTPARAKELHEGHHLDLWARWTEFEQRFDELQSEFIEEPREAVNKAEQLIQEVVDHMANAIRDSVRTLHRDVREDTDTEELRLTMRDYRDFIRSLGHREAA